ncbi:hypothetical protein RRX38_05290 [Pseudomonas sp. DTU_2021_1001937_2_SI_NGA_ILE_001]|uniref:hypothetical protein n=1 Tax=Pseudomonas sp. DTU_2021_1001937_2_SI_NGA_ILE_001 TaxID=3077589 RepID=UPI0028FC1C13|nr:hypothetical protein [Pseudomonas sp. DTU_2021_1001937_2_SI_NGA_ILE_001]WNW10591.1 hypothetical protein RRX38_05290 [Pseudomonas sp. DTU_2021_1001937_2_SI_NGA_ILE_001]
MSQNGITLPPIIVTPEPPLLSPSGNIGGGVVARPLPWNGQVAAAGEIDEFFNKKGVRNEHYAVSVVVTVASAQRSIEQSFMEYLSRLTADVDAEIMSGLEPYGYSGLQRAVAEKSIVDDLIVQNEAEWSASNVAAHSFFGRHALAVETVKSAVHFANIFHGARHKAPLGKLRTSCPSAGNGRLRDAEKPDFQPLIIGKPRHSLGFLSLRVHLSRSRQ